MAEKKRVSVSMRRREWSQSRVVASLKVGCRDIGTFSFPTTSFDDKVFGKPDGSDCKIVKSE